MPSALRRRRKAVLTMSKMPEVGVSMVGAGDADAEADADAERAGGGAPPLGLVEQPRSGRATRSGRVRRERIGRRRTIATERRGEGARRRCDDLRCVGCAWARKERAWRGAIDVGEGDVEFGVVSGSGATGGYSPSAVHIGPGYKATRPRHNVLPRTPGARVKVPWSRSTRAECVVVFRVAPRLTDRHEHGDPSRLDVETPQLAPQTPRR